MFKDDVITWWNYLFSNDYLYTKLAFFLFFKGLKFTKKAGYSNSIPLPGMNLMAHHQQREQAATGSSKPETGENALEMANAEV